MENKTIAVLGGGASGMTAAINAAYVADGNIKIIICERMARLGRKLLATGNGRCNYTNMNALNEPYLGEHPSFAKIALSNFDPGSTVVFFSRLGVFPKEEEGGKMFPYSDQASSVLDALRFEIDRLGIEVRTEFDVKEVEKTKKGFLITSYKGERLSADRVIAAFGGCASPNLGSNGSGYKILKSLGHNITELSPALVQIRLKEDWLKALSGIKFKGRVGILVNNILSCEEEGEILFTDYGISGPPVFQLSLKIPEYKNPHINLDFMPDYDTTEIYRLLSSRASALKHLTMENFFGGLLNKRIGNVVTRRAGIEKLSKPVGELSKDVIWALAYNIKFFKAETAGLNGWNNAQVTAGGASTKQFSNMTMESKKVKGLYCCGELLDIHGRCGGYNLQWAWSSGYLAGVSAAGGLLE